MRSFLFALARGLVVISGTPVLALSQSSAREAPPASAALDRQMNATVERKVIPGVVAIAADRRGVIYQGAFGMAETGSKRAMTADAIFRIASMTKAVTSVALMQLVEQGRIALEDPASKYLPEFAHPMVVESFDPATGAYKLRPAVTTVTVRHLITHTSGLGYTFTSAILRDLKPREGERFEVGPLLFEPGTQWVYGTGVDMAGRIVESLSGKTLEVYFRERIFTPLGMLDTFYNVPPDKQSRIVNVFRRLPDDSFEEQPRQIPPPQTRFNGGGGLYSTAGDYIRFLQMLLNGGEWNGAKILARETVALMGRNQIGAVGVRALQSALPRSSSDFSFVADGRDKWGVGFMITSDQVPGKRSPGSLSWGGMDNTYFWLDPARGVAGVIMMQFLPFADVNALEVYDSFERGVYQIAGG